MKLPIKKMTKVFNKDNSVIFVPVLGAASLFFLNVYLKIMLPSQEYGGIAVQLFIMSVLFVLSGLGYEQSIVRQTKVVQSKVLTGKLLVIFSIAIPIASPFIMVEVFGFLGKDIEMSVGIFFLVWCVSSCVIFSSFGKVGGNLASSYISVSFWKIILLPVMVFLISMGVEYQFDHVMVVGVFLGLAFSFYVFFKRNEIDIEKGDSIYVSVLFLMGGAISILGYGIFDSMDRFVLGEKLSVSEFGDYYFLYVFIVSPVLIVTSFFSSKKIHIYKTTISRRDIRGDVVITYVLAFSLALSLALVVMLAEKISLFGLDEITMELVVFLVLMASVKGGYSMVSAVYNVVCRSLSLTLTGVLSVIVGSGFCFAITEFGYDYNLYEIISFIVLLWVLRTIYVCFLIKYDIRRI